MKRNDHAQIPRVLLTLLLSLAMVLLDGPTIALAEIAEGIDGTANDLATAIESVTSGENEGGQPDGDNTIVVSNEEEVRDELQQIEGEDIAADAKADTIELGTQSVGVSNPRIVEDSSMASGQKVMWDCVWLGSYPQTEIWPSDSIYKSLEAADWNENGDATVDGARYRRIEGSRFESSREYSFFRYEPIKWRVLQVSNSTALVLADKVLDEKTYDSYDEVFFEGTTWEKSEIRSWLNGYDAASNQLSANFLGQGFLDIAFSDDEKDAILQTDVINDHCNEFSIEGGNDTSDRVFLLSQADVCGESAASFGFASDPQVDDPARHAWCTDYVHVGEQAHGTYNTNAWQEWWTRSLGNDDDLACIVWSNGNLDCEGYNVNHDGGVRPALTIDISSPLVLAAGVVSSDETVDELAPTGWISTSTGKRTYPEYNQGAEAYYTVDTYDIDRVKGYEGFSHLHTEGSYAVPGLEFTNVGSIDNQLCDAMVPQGICATQDYILITAYCAGDLLSKNIAEFESNGYPSFYTDSLPSKAGHEQHPSVIYVLNRLTGALVKTIALDATLNRPESSHVGGIAYDADTDSIWIATSGYRIDGLLQEYRIPLYTVTSCMNSSVCPTVHLPDDDSCLASIEGTTDINSASFNTYWDGLLWVGNNIIKDNQVSTYAHTRLVGYRPIWDENEYKYKLVKEREFGIPTGANGATFFEYDDGKSCARYLMVNVSRGRAYKSLALIYNLGNYVSGDKLTIDKAYAHPLNQEIALPPMLEEACVYDGTIYSVFESGATVYSCLKGSVTSPTGSLVKEAACPQSVDEMCITNFASMLDKRAKVKSRLGGNGAAPKASSTHVSVACPVDVTLHDADGNVVGRIANGNVDELLTSHTVMAWTDGETKHFMVSNDEDYTLGVDATGNGTMDVCVTQHDENGGVSSLVSYEGVRITEGDALLATIAKQDNTVQTAGGRTELVSADGHALYPSVQVDDAHDMQTHAVDVQAVGDGEAYGDGTVAHGDYAFCEATPTDGATFLGWFVDGVRVGLDTLLQYPVIRDVQIEARFSTSSVGRPDEQPQAKEITAVRIAAKSFTYDGKAKTPAVTVQADGTTVPSSSYSVTYANNINAGTATVIVKGKGNYKGTKKAAFTINKAANGLSVRAKTATLKASKLIKKKQTVSTKRAYSVSNASGKVTYKLSSVSKKKFKRYFSVNKKSGKVTVKKGLGKGTYKLKVKVTASGDANHEVATKSVTVKIKVKERIERKGGPPFRSIRYFFTRP